MRTIVAAFALAACYQPPDLPIATDLEIIPSNACAIDREAYVACVLDGDTIELESCGGDAESVRMLGVDAPEIEHPPDPADCYGDASHLALTDLLQGQRVTLTFDAECQDVYLRTLAYVWLKGSGLDRLAGDPDLDTYLRTIPGEDEPALLVNEWVISRGWAEVFPEEAFGRILYQDELELAEADAVQRARGTWGVCGDP